MHSIRAAAKQACDEEALMEIMRQDFMVKSMNPNGHYAYELTCMWQNIHQLRRFECQIPVNVMKTSLQSRFLQCEVRLRKCRKRSFSRVMTLCKPLSFIALLIGLVARWRTTGEMPKYKQHWNPCLLEHRKVIGFILKMHWIFTLP